MLKSLLSGRKRRRQRQLPAGIRVYAVGDIHGRADLLRQVLARIDDHLRRHPVARPVHVFVGDYIDRGPASREVIDLLIGCAADNEAVFLKGNHEAFLLGFLQDPAELRGWSRNGGLETLMSYGLDPRGHADPKAQNELAALLARALPPAHRGFLGSLQPSFTCGDYFFAHAGVRPGTPLKDQVEDDLLWIRGEFLLHEGDFGKRIVHGHTPVMAPDIRPNRINIDTGAYATGRLTCLVIEGETVEILDPD
jgi:serine/threonine protein phosphatase 1